MKVNFSFQFSTFRFACPISAFCFPNFCFSYGFLLFLWLLSTLCGCVYAMVRPVPKQRGFLTADYLRPLLALW